MIDFSRIFRYTICIESERLKIMKKEQTFEVSWAYGETTFINAHDLRAARVVAVGMGRALALGKVLWVLPTEKVKG